jgi:hypothetical protein
MLIAKSKIAKRFLIIRCCNAKRKTILWRISMASKIETVSGVCEMCGSLNNPEDMYVDLFNSNWTLECSRCFYSRNEGRESDYYDRVKVVRPEVLTAKKYNKINKAMIVVADSFPYLSQDNFSVEDKSHLFQEAVDKLVKSKKFISKFIPVNVAGKSQEHAYPDGNMFVVSVRAYVKFRSYLEYLEHEMYMQFRKECPSLFRGVQ